MLLPGLNTLLSIIVIKKYYMLRDETVAWLVSHSIIQSFSPACVNRLQKTTHVFEFFCDRQLKCNKTEIKLYLQGFKL